MKLHPTDKINLVREKNKCTNAIIRPYKIIVLTDI